MRGLASFRIVAVKVLGRSFKTPLYGWLERNHGQRRHLASYTDPASDPIKSGIDKDLSGSSEQASKARDDPEQSQYQKKTQLEHVLLRPDVYVGSMEQVTKQMLVYDVKSSSVRLRSISYIPGLLKIFDEILVNAADNKQRDVATKQIKVKFDKKNATVQVYNDGKGIPVCRHAKYDDVYIPELVMGNLLAGSNFDDTKTRLAGGRHGYGAKLTNIFSSVFTIETVDSSRALLYRQTWRNNMTTCEPPTIEKLTGKAEDYTKVTFTIDLKRFGKKSLDDDTIALWARRVVDVAGCNNGLKCWINGTLVKVRSFQDLMLLYRSALTQEKGAEGAKAVEVIEDNSGRWKVAVGSAVNNSSSELSMSFVNSVWTSRGGTHLKHVQDLFIKYVATVLNNKYKDLDVNERTIRNNMWIGVAALIENPSFDTQGKELLVTPTEKFGSEFKVSRKKMEEVVQKTEIVERIVKVLEGKLVKDLDKSSKTMGAWSQKRLLLPKLEDANWAGTAKSRECTLILTEGDSAKALAVSGLSVLGRDRYGVFPLKGKLINVREATNLQVKNNTELAAIKAILGLQNSATYDLDKKESSAFPLRYGKVMLMTDQDHDGSHIKGLFINMIHAYWPELLRSNQFLFEFVTPIVKVYTGSQDLRKTNKAYKTFFTQIEFKQWWDSLQDKDRNKFHIKYYKGLGTNTAQEGKEYFSNLESHRLSFVYDGKQDDNSITLAFSKDADERKKWIQDHADSVVKDFIDHSKDKLSFTDFVYKELVQYSYASLQRAIPSLIDGCKPSQRKILYACFKRKLNKEIKVAQLAGYISEHTAYHHGENSLHSAIVKMAQRFVGSNNLPLLYPSGQFGTRLQGGEDAASPRYIFTSLNSYTRMIFPEEDDLLLIPQSEDGLEIEPRYYIPIIPMTLVNGAQGIGTGWSTSIPSYNPFEIITILRSMIRESKGGGGGQESLRKSRELVPWYAGFKGTIQKHKDGERFTCSGCFEVEDTNPLRIRVTELPIGMWTEDFQDHLNRLSDKTEDRAAMISSYTTNNSEAVIDTTITFTEDAEKKLMESGKLNKQELMKVLKLINPISLGNMVLFAADGKIKQYYNPLDILADYFPERMRLYERRKQMQEARLAAQAMRFTNQYRFLGAVASGEFKFEGKSKDELEKELKEKGFNTQEEIEKVFTEKKHVAAPKSEGASLEAEEEEEEELKESNNGFAYLLQMPMWSATRERREKLKKQVSSTGGELRS